ncbi:MAG: DUF4943 family protein [Bacteroidia bacterium]|nr:DUF4943 family protein [Bacteroidia bacterium]
MCKFTLSFLLIVVFGLFYGCGPASTIVEVQVLNVETQQPIDSANVVLYRYYDRDYLTVIDSQWTSAATEGKISFRFVAEEGYRYRVETTRKFFQPVLNENGATYDNQLEIVPADSNTAILLLEMIPPPDPEKYALIHPNVPVNQVIGALSTDTWEWVFLPKLYWEDIPALLMMGGDSTFVNSYPRQAQSTYRPDSVRTGLVALWLIEAIRKGTLASEEITGDLMPPSRVPVLGTSKGNPKGFNSTAQIRTALKAYQDWWESVKTLEKTEAAKTNPLSGTGMSWM